MVDKRLLTEDEIKNILGLKRFFLSGTYSKIIKEQDKKTESIICDNCTYKQVATSIED